MEDEYPSTGEHSAIDVIYALAEQAVSDAPKPERIVIQAVGGERYVCRIEVLDDDQPHGFPFTVGEVG